MDTLLRSSLLESPFAGSPPEAQPGNAPGTGRKQLVTDSSLVLFFGDCSRHARIEQSTVYNMRLSIVVYLDEYPVSN